MEKRDGGYFISNEEIRHTGKVLGYVGIGCLVVGIMRSLIWGPVVRISNE